MNGTSDEDMKEHAETVMNELLGWYGYEKLNEVDSKALNLCLFPHSTNSASESVGVIEYGSVDFQKTIKSVPSSSVQSPSFRSFPASSEKISVENVDLGPVRRNINENGEDVSSTPVPGGVEQHLYCGWCKNIKKSRNFPFRTKNCDQTFCSESCFAHYTRLNTKQNKTCDWCRHVRHTISYVDFDGDGQYQFCSDKCLNQFKLDIFCQETKEHLEIHPHHCDQLKDTRNTSLSSLITPDLWLRNCTSNTPTFEKSTRSVHKPTFPSSKHFSLTTEMKKTKESPILVEISPAVANLRSTSEDERINTKITNEIFTSPVRLLTDQLQNHTEPESPQAMKISSTVSNSLISSSENEDIQTPWLSNLTQAGNNHERHQNPLQKKVIPHNSQIPPLLPLINYKKHSPTEISTSPSSIIAPAQADSIFTNALFPPPTLLVPYPVILPLPIPFPIPFPLPILGKDAKKENATSMMKCEDVQSNSIFLNHVDSNDSIDSAWSLSSASRFSLPSGDTHSVYDHAYENKIKKLKKN